MIIWWWQCLRSRPLNLRRFGQQWQYLLPIHHQWLRGSRSGSCPWKGPSGIWISYTTNRGTTHKSFEAEIAWYWRFPFTVPRILGPIDIPIRIVVLRLLLNVAIIFAQVKFKQTVHHLVVEITSFNMAWTQSESRDGGKNHGSRWLTFSSSNGIIHRYASRYLPWRVSGVWEGVGARDQIDSSLAIDETRSRTPGCFDDWRQTRSQCCCVALFIANYILCSQPDSSALLRLSLPALCIREASFSGAMADKHVPMAEASIDRLWTIEWKGASHHWADDWLVPDSWFRRKLVSGDSRVDRERKD